MLLTALQMFWPALLAVLASAAASPAVRGYREAILTAVLAVGAGLACVWATRVAFPSAADPAHSQDLLRTFGMAAAAPVLAVGAAALARRRSRSTWAPPLLAVLLGATWVLASPLMLLLLACSTGDCL